MGLYILYVVGEGGGGGGGGGDVQVPHIWTTFAFGVYSNFIVPVN
jgi:hypothetical protein